MQIYLPIYSIIIELHDTVLDVSGGKSGLLNADYVRAAIDRPRTYLAYNENSDLHSICAVLLDSLARNHAFVEGNKRTALMTVIFTYELNNITLEFTEAMNEEFEDLVLWVVLEKPTVDEITKRLRSLVEKFSKPGASVIMKRIRSRLKPFNAKPKT